jgi:hypothetical protein
MPKPCSLDLRERVLDAVETGASRREAAERFEVSASLGCQMDAALARNRKCSGQADRGGSISPLEKHADCLLALIAEQPDLRTSATTSESLCARAPCGDVTRGGGIPGVPIGQYADRHDRHASDSQTLEYRRLEA